MSDINSAYDKWIKKQEEIRPKDIHDYSMLSVFRDVDNCIEMIEKLKERQQHLA